MWVRSDDCRSGSSTSFNIWSIGVEVRRMTRAIKSGHAKPTQLTICQNLLARLASSQMERIMITAAELRAFPGQIGPWGLFLKVPKC